MHNLLSVLLSISFFVACGQESTVIKVHCLYGSKPKRQYKGDEKKWFGGKLGGHVGIEFRKDKIINFVPSGKFHYVAHKNDRNSKFAIHSREQFYSIFGSHPDSVKYAVFHIPISTEQKNRLDSIVMVYMQEVPYDYAFLGMRCAAAAYDILDEIDIIKDLRYRRTIFSIFYPRRLRKRLFRRATKNGWKINRQEGTHRRKWEKDVQ